MRLAAARAIALMLAAAIGAPPAGADEAAPKSAAMSHGWGFSEQGGAALFQNVCAGCHQPDGKGAVGAASYPSLVADQQLASADFMVSVLLGGLNAMPPVGGMMSDAQVADVVNYVRTHFSNSYPDAVSAEAVSAARRRSASAP